MKPTTTVSVVLLSFLVALNTRAERPNIILCMTDDQGWGDVSHNGLKKIRTPNLDAMAAAGLRFDRFYAQQSCSPTRASVMTGRHPNRMGVFWPGMPIRTQEITIAQALKVAGYATGHFGKWHLNGVAGPGKVIATSDPFSPRNLGFDESFSVSNYFELNWTFGRNGIPQQVAGDGSDAIVAEALKFIRQATERRRPFLAVVWFGSPHVPHQPLPADLEAAGGSAYYGELVGVDRSMGTLRAGLRELGIADNTLVWFCSDNGGWIDPKRPDAHGTNAGLRGRKGDMWEGGIRVPCVVEWPARIKRGRATGIPAGVIDIYPTLVDLLHVEVPNQVRPLDGISLIPLLDGKMTARPRPMGFWQYAGGSAGKENFTPNSGPSAWNDNRFKLVKPQPGRWELYDLTADPSETRDVADRHPEVLARMKAELEAWQWSVIRSFQGQDYPERQVIQPEKPRAGAEPQPLRGLLEVPPDHVKLRGGFWGPRLELHNQVTIAHALDALEKNGHVTNFDKAAGSYDGQLRGHHAFDSDLHKVVEGAIYSLHHNPNKVLSQRVEGILDRVLAAQQSDGFLISCFIVKDQDKRWDDLRLEHQMYNAGHFFEMAVAHGRLTGNPRALNAARRFADHIDGIFGPNKRYDVDGHQEVELALIKLYRATGERRYLELARFFLDERGHAHGTERKPFDPATVVPTPPPDPSLSKEELRRANVRARLRVRNGRMQDHKPVVEQHEAVGHAVRAGYMYAAMADIVRLSNAPGYEAALDNLWKDVVSRKMYLSGGIGTAQYGDEGFGDPYHLPNLSAYTESCAAVAHVLWQHRMSLLKGHARYVDVMELALYNGVLSGIAVAGDRFCYQNPLGTKAGRERSSWIGLACCPSNLARIIPQVGGLAYARGRDQIRVNLYLAGDASVKLDDGLTVNLAQETDYPWDGRIRLTVTPEKAAEFSLLLRIPGWAQGRPVPSDLYRFADNTVPDIGLKVNGQQADSAPQADGYVHLARRWQAGDVVELNLPMPIHRVHGHEQIQDTAGKVALMRGPILYCLESLDQPNVDLFALALSPKGELRAEHRPDLLKGVTVLQGTALADGGGRVAVTAVPFYAWGNRGKMPMAVWIRTSGPVE